MVSKLNQVCNTNLQYICLILFVDLSLPSVSAALDAAFWRLKENTDLQTRFAVGVSDTQHKKLLLIILKK